MTGINNIIKPNYPTVLLFVTLSFDTASVWGHIQDDMDNITYAHGIHDIVIMISCLLCALTFIMPVVCCHVESTHTSLSKPLQPSSAPSLLGALDFSLAAHSSVVSASWNRNEQH